jgi:O-antigen ligase
MHAVFPNLIMSLNKVLLSVDSYAVIQRTYSFNYHSGITNQPAAAGMFSIVFIAIVFSKLLTTTGHKKLIYFQLVMGLVSLLLTQKRSFLIALFLAVYYVLFVYTDRSKYKKFARIFFVSILLIFLTIGVLLFVPSTRNVLERLFQDDDLLGARSVLYNTLIQWFQSNKLWGEGLGASQTTFGYGGHNIYLQVLAETGIIGFSIFFIAFIGQMFSNVKRSTRFFKLFPQSKEEHFSLVFTIFMQAIILVYGLSGNPIFDYPFFLLIIFILSIPDSVFRRIDI